MSAGALLGTSAVAVVASVEGILDPVESLLKLRRFAVDLEVAVAAALQASCRCSVVGPECECIAQEDAVGASGELAGPYTASHTTPHTTPFSSTLNKRRETR